jgi:predicted nucleic acid-binding protein
VISPRSAIVLDASLLIAAAIGRNAAALDTAAKSRHLVTPVRALQEARRRIELGLKQPEVLLSLDEIVSDITVVPERDTDGHIERAKVTLKDAAASQNGSIKDAHILACAWVTGADIWSFDRDFAGTGVASWSTANLMRALAAEAQ